MVEKLYEKVVRIELKGLTGAVEGAEKVAPHTLFHGTQRSRESAPRRDTHECAVAPGGAV